MAKKRRTRRREEMFSRTFEVTSYQARIGYAAVSPRGEEPYAESHLWLVARGTLDEPIKDMRDIQVHTYPRDSVQIGTARPASIGSIIQVKPHISVVAPSPHLEFDRLWALALAGQMKFGYLYFTKPHYGNALVTNLSFSNEREDDE